MSLDRRLTFSAEPAPIDRVPRITLELQRATFASSDKDSATGGTLIATSGIPERNPGDDLLRLGHIGDKFLNRLLSTSNRSNTACSADDLKEISAAVSVRLLL
jgi:hypothetical protein